MTPGSDSIQVRLQLVWFCFVFASALVRPALECTSGALRWSSRCLPLAPLASRMVTCTASKTPHVMNIFELVPVSVYVAAARRIAAWHTPTVPKFLRHLPLTSSPRERVGYRLHNRHHDVQPRPSPLHIDLFHLHTARSCNGVRLCTRGVRV